MDAIRMVCGRRSDVTDGGLLDWPGGQRASGPIPFCFIKMRKREEAATSKDIAGGSSSVARPLFLQVRLHNCIATARMRDGRSARE